MKENKQDERQLQRLRCLNKSLRLRNVWFKSQVYLERLHAVWDGEGGALVLQVHPLLLSRLLCLLFQHGHTDLQQQALAGKRAG